MKTFKPQEIAFTVDDTITPKYGKKIFGRGLHFDHAAKENFSKYIKGHNWIVLGFLQYIPAFSKWICFPFMTELFIPQKSLSRGRAFFSRIDLAISMLKKVRAFLNCGFTVVTDALYVKRHFVRTCKDLGITMISRIRKDAALYKPLKLKKKAKRKRGRPRKYGGRMSSLVSLAKKKYLFRPLRIYLYNKEKMVFYYQMRAYWKPAQSLIKVFIVKYPKNGGFITSYFFTTDMGMHVGKLLKYVAGRWSLENAFKDMKQHLGFNGWQCRKEESVKRSTLLTCISYSTLLLWCHKEMQKKQLTIWDPVPWDNDKKYVSVSDMIYLLKNQCVTKCILSAFGENSTNRKKIKEFKHIFRLAA